MSHMAEKSHAAWRQLAFEWGRTQEDWRDSASEYFEKTWWRPLEDEARDYARALEMLMETLEAALEAAL